MNQKKYKKGKRKIRFDRILIFLVILVVIIWTSIFILNIKISNIFILNNSFLNDQYIIEKALISDYPSVIKNPNFLIKKRLEKDDFIKSVKVYKKGFSKVYIEVLENRPLFYDEVLNKTVLSDKKKVNENFSVPIVINDISDNYYDLFIEQMDKIDNNILRMISEIEFVPNEVDDNRFYLTMSDGNFIYININTFEKLNMYLTIKENLPKEKGILYLDYGNNFEIIK